VEGIGLEEAYVKWADELVRFATVLVGPDDAADVVADAFVQLLDQPDWGRVDQPRAYLFGVVANRAKMSQRSSFRRRRRDERVVRRQRVAAPEAAAHSSAADDLGVLSAQQRTFVYLAYWEDWTATQIAEQLGVSGGTVRRQLARARTKLREELA